MTNHNHHNEEGEYDLFKHSPMRYLGYTNEIGEAFRAFLPKSVVLATYAVATVYALGDAVDKGIGAYKKFSFPSSENCNVAESTTKQQEQQEQQQNSSAFIAFNKELRRWHVAERTTDTAIWQLLASVTVPAYLINRVVHGTSYVLNKSVSVNSAWRGRGVFKLIPTLAGLSMIPVMPHLLDPVIDWSMDRTTRPLFKSIIARKASSAGENTVFNSAAVSSTSEQQTTETGATPSVEQK